MIVNLLVSVIFAVGSTNFIGLPNQSEVVQEQCVRRVAFELGSGSSKITVGDVDPKTNKINKIWLRTKIVTALQKDLACSKDGSLSEKAKQELMEAIKELKNKASKFSPVQWSAIGTSVFRTAKNGREILDEVEVETGLTVQLLSQDDEAKIGFATAIGTSNEAQEDVIAWDVGAGSFQIASYVDGNTEMYGSEISHIFAYEQLLAIRGQAYSPEIPLNPVTSKEALELIGVIRNSLPILPDWMKNHKKVLKLESGELFSKAAVLEGKTAFTKEEILQAIYQTTGKGDQELSYSYESFKNIVPKLAFAFAVMDYCGIDQFTNCDTNGNTEGMLITPEFWQ